MISTEVRLTHYVYALREACLVAYEDARAWPIPGLPPVHDAHIAHTFRVMDERINHKVRI